MESKNVIYTILASIFIQVLDMCAAPGSKTAQLIELMNENLDRELPSL